MRVLVSRDRSGQKCFRSWCDPDNNIYDLVSAELYEKAGRIPDAIPCSKRRLAQQTIENAIDTLEPIRGAAIKWTERGMKTRSRRTS